MGVSSWVGGRNALSTREDSVFRVVARVTVLAPIRAVHYESGMKPTPREDRR